MRRTRVNQETPFGAVRMSVIDISLNSVKLLIATKQMNGKIDFDKDESTINLLSKIVRNKKSIKGEAYDNLMECLNQYLQIALKYCEPRFTKIVSSEVLTEVENKDEILERINSLWFERVETALYDRIALWEKEMKKPKKTESKPSSTKDPDKVRKDFMRFIDHIRDKYNLELSEFLENRDLVLEFIHDEYQPDITFYSRDECIKLYYNLIFNDIQKTHRYKFTPNSTIVDLTGDSINVVQCEGGEIVSQEIFNIGILNYTEKYIKDGNIEKKDIPLIRKPAHKFFNDNMDIAIPENLIFVGGNAINIARICREVPVTRSNDVHGYIIRKADLEELLEGLCALSFKKRNTLIGLQEGRQNTILSACVILLEFMDRVGEEEGVLSTYGLRHKKIIDLLEENFEIEKKKRDFEEFKAKYPEANI